MINWLNLKKGQNTLKVRIKKLMLIQTHYNIERTTDSIQKVIYHILYQAQRLMNIKGCLFKRIMEYPYGERLTQCYIKVFKSTKAYTPWLTQCCIKVFKSTKA
jgi:hypothetical protein